MLYRVRIKPARPLKCLNTSFVLLNLEHNFNVVCFVKRLLDTGRVEVDSKNNKDKMLLLCDAVESALIIVAYQRP